jgi:hypothetical protein
MTAKITADASGTKVTIGTAAEDALQIDATAKTIKALAPYQMNGNGPAFSAWTLANISLTASAFQLVNFDQEDFDTNNAFASGVFTPNVAGYYQVNFTVITSGGTNASIVIALFKNGVRYLDGQVGFVSGASENIGGSGSAVVYMNGTTDYLDVRVFTSSLPATIVGANRYNSNFSACLVRTA